MTNKKLTSGTLSATPARLRAAFPESVDTSPVRSLANVFLGDRRIWTFRIDQEHWDTTSNKLDVAWPAALVPHLSGVATGRLEVCAEPNNPTSHLAEGDLDFGGEQGKLQLVDRITGDELVVNKWGRLEKSFEAGDEKLQQEVLRSANNLVALLKKTLGLELFITGKTLLGLVRDGQLISSDDADLAYLSQNENPSDIVLESYEVERLLARNGFETVRHSSAHLQVMFGGTAYTDGYYVDIFTYFMIEDWFYGTFHAREKSEHVTVLPLRTLEHDGLELPIPANIDQMLTAIYGPTWQTPDPAFTFVTPESAGRRFYWWLNHYDPFREDWEDYHRSLVSSEAPTEPSSLAKWLTSNLESGSTVLELGCGLGTDARAIAGAGHHVLAVDFSRPAIAYASANNGAAPSPSGMARFEVGNVNSIRDMAAITKRAARLAGSEAPITVFSRNLFDNLHFLGRDSALLALSHLLSRGGRAYLQMRNPKMGNRLSDRTEPVGETIFDPWEFSGRLEHYGLQIVETNFLLEPGSAGSSLSYIIRKVYQQ